MVTCTVDSAQENDVTQDGRKEILQVLIKDIKKWQKINYKGNKLFGLFSDGCKYHDKVNIILDHYIRVVAGLIGDDEDWLFWYIFDNDFGKRGHTAHLGKKDFKVKTVDDLLICIDYKDGDTV